MAYMEKKIFFSVDPVLAGSDQCRYLLFICIFSSILNYLMFGVPPLLCFEIILIVFSLLICY